MTLKKDKNQILLQQRDANLKSMEQMKQLKVISKNLDDLIISYKVQAPYTSSWKSEEALTEIKNFTSKLEVIKDGVEEFDLKDSIEGFDDKVNELSVNLQNLQDIWDIVTEWEAFEKKVNIEKIQHVNVIEIR